MPITIGTQLGVHEILALLGKGGMGEVYRARDTKLKREVAVKILPDEFSRDPERVSRFQREAEVLASLNHPAIAAIHSFEEANGSRFLVLELVEGETLSERIHRGPIPINEVLNIGKNICEALEAAHEKGIVHRDLKPANVKITPDGGVKVLDFGLAKALESAPASPTLSNSPTLSMAATNAGIILGTAAYMSPEQAKGRAVDRRADVFAFGCVLYEMLTGRPAFVGDDVTEILGRVVTAEPDWNRLPTTIPTSIQRLLRRALKKDPRQRLGDIRDARLEIEEAGTEALFVSKPPRGARLAWASSLAVAAALIVGLAVPAMRHLRETLPPEMRFEISTPSTFNPFEFVLSPDGKYIAFSASGDGAQRLWLRPLDKTGFQPLPGTEGAEFPFWSPDSRSVAFFASGKLNRIDITGGAPQMLTNTARGYGGSWNADGTILFVPSLASPILRIVAAGGNPVAVTQLDPPRQLGHTFPEFLPDGRRFLFYVNGSPEAQGIYLGSLDGAQPKLLTVTDSAGRYLRGDRLLFIRQGVLTAQRLDVARGELTGEPVILANQVGIEAATRLGGFSASADGRIAYRIGDTVQRQLTWFDRSGKVLGLVGSPDAGNLVYPELSNDGRRVVVQRTVQGNPDIFQMDLFRGGLTRLTSDPAVDNYALWSPDGTQIAFRSDRNGPNLYVKSSSGAGSEKPIFADPGSVMVLQDWSKDGRFLLYYEVDPKTRRDLKVLDLTEKERKPRAFVNTSFEETLAQFSPDGRWVAYQTNDSGQPEIVVQPFPQPSGKWQISTSGGSQPRWRADGTELYFIAPDGKLMAVPVKTSGSTFEPGIPEALFSTRVLIGGVGSVNKAQYAVSRDGRFLINQHVEGSTASPITIVLNWNPDGKK